MQDQHQRIGAFEVKYNYVCRREIENTDVVFNSSLFMQYFVRFVFSDCMNCIAMLIDIKHIPSSSSLIVTVSISSVNVSKADFTSNSFFTLISVLNSIFSLFSLISGFCSCLGSSSMFLFRSRVLCFKYTNEL